MSRVPRVSTLASGWGLCALYLCAMGTLGISAVHAAYALSESVWHAATANAVSKPRDLSRVEMFYATRVANSLKPRADAADPVVALVKPDIHPAALAAAIDRAEGAIAAEHTGQLPLPAQVADTQPNPSSFDIKSWRTRAIAVAGLTCSATGCDDAEAAALSRGDAPADRTSTAAEAEQMAYAISDEAAAEAAAITMQKPSKPGKSAARQKRKDMTQDGAEPSVVKYSTYQPGGRGLRVAETPGDIIRASLLRGTI